MTTKRTTAENKASPAADHEARNSHAHDSARETNRVVKIVAVTGAIFSVVGLAGYGLHTGASVAAGAIIATSNLWVLGKIIASVLPDEPDAPKNESNEHGDERDGEDSSDKENAAGTNGGLRAAWTLFALLKIVVLFGGIFWLMSKGYVSPMPLVCGYGSLPIGIAISSMLSNMRVRR